MTNVQDFPNVKPQSSCCQPVSVELLVNILSKSRMLNGLPTYTVDFKILKKPKLPKLNNTCFANPGKSRVRSFLIFCPNRRNHKPIVFNTRFVQDIFHHEAGTMRTTTSSSISCSCVLRNPLRNFVMMDTEGWWGCLLWFRELRGVTIDSEPLRSVVELAQLYSRTYLNDVQHVPLLGNISNKIHGKCLVHLWSEFHVLLDC